MKDVKGSILERDKIVEDVLYTTIKERTRMANVEDAVWRKLEGRRNDDNDLYMLYIMVLCKKRLHPRTTYCLTHYKKIPFNFFHWREEGRGSPVLNRDFFVNCDFKGKITISM